MTGGQLAVVKGAGHGFVGVVERVCEVVVGFCHVGRAGAVEGRGGLEAEVTTRVEWGGPCCDVSHVRGERDGFGASVLPIRQR